MDRLYFDIIEQTKKFEQWQHILIGKNETLGNLVSDLLVNNSAKKSCHSEIKKIIFDLNEITTFFNSYENGFG